jgi:predicted HicB family RNase H-like nuclease
MENTQEMPTKKDKRKMFPLRLDPKLKKDAQHFAIDNDTTLTELIRELLESTVYGQQPKQRAGAGGQ